MFPDLLTSIGYFIVYLAMALTLLVAGFYALDAVTPGRLADLLMGQEGTADPGDPYGVLSGARRPSINAGVLTAANLLGVGLITFTALWTNVHVGLARSVVWTMVFGLLGVGALAVAFKVLDALTPGDLGEAICKHDPLHPLTLVSAAGLLAVAAGVAAAIA